MESTYFNEEEEELRLLLENKRERMIAKFRIEQDKKWKYRYTEEHSYFN
jgi:hypothetical protein